MRIVFTAIILFFLNSFQVFSKSVEVNIRNLECEQLINPIAIESLHPTLGWQMHAAATAKSQKAYRILVASSLSSLNRNIGDYWDSGKVRSSNSTHVIYKGKPLTSRIKLYWKVMVWDEKENPSVWSTSAHWSMGLLKPSDWKAKWIGAFENPYPDSAITYPSPFFRKEFSVIKKIKKATVYVSGLGFYELSINGKKIGDQVLAPAVTNYDKRPLKRLLYPYDDQSTQRVLYNTFDVTTTITQKNNSIGIQLGNGWYNQRDRRVEGDMWYDSPRLIFQLEILYTDGTSSIVVSDASWKTASSPLLKDGIFTGETYDARLEIDGWNKAGFKDLKWNKAILVRSPTGVLRSQLAPPDKTLRTIVPKFAGKTKDSVYTFQLDETISGWASVSVSGNAGSKLKIRYISEEGEDYGQFDTYILKGSGIETWEPKFTWHAFRKIEVTSANVLLDSESIKIKDVHTNVQANGTFECSNPFLNTINSAYIKTQNANFHGSISSDCPHRERLGYTGDGQVIVESSIFSYDMRQFYRKWFNDMDDARNKKTGFVTHTAPFGGGGGGPAWGSAYVIMPWSYFSYYGDTTILTEHYAGMKHWVEYLQTRTNKEGLINREEPNGWCLGDWCTPTNVEIPAEFVNTAYFYYVTDIMSRVAKIMGKSDDYSKFSLLAKEIKSNFNKAYFNTTKQSYWEGRQSADAFALAFGLVPEGNYKQVFNSLLSHLEKISYHFDTGILGTPLLIKVLSENNRDDVAYKIMNQKAFPGFGYLLNPKNSTLWETWDGQGSKSHPMFGSVIEWFYYGLGGIKIDNKAIGMKHFKIEPKFVEDLNFCKTSYNSQFGKIRSEWKRSAGGKVTVVIEIPHNTSATFIHPGGKSTQFTSGIHQFEL